MTEADFVTTVAENLGVLGAGQTVSNEDGILIRRRMAGVFARLAREELTTVANTNDIPAAECLALADIVAFECAVPFGISGPKRDELGVAAIVARDSLRLVLSERPHKDTLGQTRWWGFRRRGTYNGTG